MNRMEIEVENAGRGRVALTWICVVVFALLGAACGGDDNVGNADASASSASASAPTTAAISMDTAAQQYLTLVAAPDCAIGELNAAIKDVATTPSGRVSENAWPAIQATVVPALVKVEATGRDWATALLKAQWPASVASDVDTLALAARDTSTRYGEIARTKDFDGFFELYNSADTTAMFGRSTAAAKKVREELGLDSVTTNPPECTGATSA